MRRRYAMALGGCLAASAVGLAQQAAPMRNTVPARYPTPYAVAPQQAVGSDGTVMMEQTTMVQPVAAPGTMLPPPQNSGQFIPVQPIQTYSATPNSNGTMQYVPIQPVPAAQAQMSSNQTMLPVQSQSMAPQMQVGQPVMMSGQNSQPNMGMQPNTGVQTVGSPFVVMQQPSTPAQSTPAQSAAAGGQQSNQQQTNPGNKPGGNVQGCPAGNCQNGNPCGNCNNNCGNCQNVFGNGCGSCQQKCCQPCGPDGRFWLSGEYLLWWSRGLGVPALVTTAQNGTPQAAAGVPGDPRTTTIFGDDKIDDKVQSGFRLRLGYWFDCCNTCGFEGSYFFLGDKKDHFFADCTTAANLARPFFNVDPRNNGGNGGDVPDSQLICFPNLVNGRIAIDTSTSFTGFDANLRKNLSCDCCNRIDGVVGFRYLRLIDDLTIDENLTVLATNLNTPAGTAIQVDEFFGTRNEFYGAQVGLTGEHRRCNGVYVSWRALVALGSTHKEATINGQTTLATPGGPVQTFNGGLLAQPTNIGHYTKNDFAVVPEFGLNVGYQFSDHVRVFAGYSFLYWSNVTRTGDIIDLQVNGSQIPPGTLNGPARPRFSWQDTDFWAQGVNFGAELRY